MEVNLIGMMQIHPKYQIQNKYSHKSEIMAAACMHGCQTDKSFEQILEENDNAFARRMVRGAIRSKTKSTGTKIPHTTVPGFTEWVFELRDVSRVLTHQLVRHRTAWNLQQSQRTVDPTDKPIVVPQTIIDEGYERAYRDIMRQTKSLYRLMVEVDGVPREDARYLLPPAYTSNIYMKIDGANLIHFFKLRTDIHAQWEIQDLANRMWELVKVEAPNIFDEEHMEYWW